MRRPIVWILILFAAAVGGVAIADQLTGVTVGKGNTTGVRSTTAVASDFSIAASPSSLSVTAGGAAVTSTISTAITLGVAQNVSLAASGQPNGTSVSFSPTAVTAGNSSTATITSDVTTVGGTYTITVTGTAASGSHTATITLTVTGAGFVARNIGVNLDAQSYFNSYAWTADAAHALCGGDKTGWGAPVDATTGYPSDNTSHTALTNQWYPAGVYNVSWSGPPNNLSISNNVGGDTWTHTAGANTGTYTRPAADVGVNNIRVTITAPGVTNLSIMAPASLTTGSFLTQFVNRMRPFSTIRAMDLLLVINSSVKNWSDRIFPPPNYAAGCDAQDYARRGVLYEDLIKLANELNKDLWIPIPIGVTDDYICRLARLMAYGEPGDKLDAACNPSAAGTPSGTFLNSASNLYLELSNELWNFSQGNILDNFCMATGMNPVGHDPDCLSFPACFPCVAPRTSPQGVVWDPKTGYGSAWVMSQLASTSPIASSIIRQKPCTLVNQIDTAACGVTSTDESGRCHQSNWGGGLRCAGQYLATGVATQDLAGRVLMDKRIHDVFTTVWTTAGRNTAKLRVVFGQQMANSTTDGQFSTPLTAMQFLDAAYGAGTHSSVYYALATNPYFTQKNGGAAPATCTPTAATNATCLNDMFATQACTPVADGFCYDFSYGVTPDRDLAFSLDTTNPTAGDQFLQWLSNSVATANNASINLPLIVYEGGQSLSGASAGQNNWDVQDDVRMYTTYVHLFNIWKAKTDGQAGFNNHLFMHYAFTGNYGTSGFWGALRNQGFSGSQRWDAMLSLAAVRGDVNLDGVANAADCTIMTGAGNWCQTGKFWQDGDLNHDGKVSDADRAILNAQCANCCAQPSPCAP